MALRLHFFRRAAADGGDQEEEVMRKIEADRKNVAAEDRARFSRTRPRSFLSAGGGESALSEEGTERTPERALMLAVLEDAVACYAGRLKAPRENPRILRRQAEFWLSCEDWD
jgi:hypothetical protein